MTERRGRVLRYVTEERRSSNAAVCEIDKQCGLVVQLVRMPACHAGGRRFEPVPGRQFLRRICWCGSTVEQLICNQQVGGSIPSTSSNKKLNGECANSSNNMTSLKNDVEGFPSGQRGRTVNPLAKLSMVRIHLPRPIFAEVAQG